jgi:hypothetical protein
VSRRVGLRSRHILAVLYHHDRAIHRCGRAHLTWALDRAGWTCLHSPGDGVHGPGRRIITAGRHDSERRRGDSDEPRPPQGLVWSQW